MPEAFPRLFSRCTRTPLLLPVAAIFDALGLEEIDQCLKLQDMELLDRGVGGVVVGYCANCPCACHRLASAVIKVWPSAPILLLVFCEPPNPRHPQQLTHAMNHTWRAYRGSSSTKPAWTPCSVSSMPSATKQVRKRITLGDGMIHEWLGGAAWPPPS